jgi:hypothetical protein
MRETATDDPTTLWHYTDANGLFGIVASGRLRFGDAQFLNDRTEQAYGRDVLKEVFAERCRKFPDDTLLRDLKDHVDTERSWERLYLCSFSAMRDSISQWQRYGADGSGYCIGFDREALDDVLDFDDVDRVRMIYDTHEQREFLLRHVTSAIKKYRRAVSDTPDADLPSPYDAVFTSGGVDYATLQLKNPCFRDELEWRCYVEVNQFELLSGFEEEYAVRGIYIQPFLEYPRLRRRRTAARLPITGVICGPRLDKYIAVPTAERFLKAHGSTP